MRATYLTVAGRIRRDLQDLDQVVIRTVRIWQQASAKDWDDTDNYYIDATALNLHGFYAGLERLLEMIADGIDSSVARASKIRRLVGTDCCHLNQANFLSLFGLTAQRLACLTFCYLLIYRTHVNAAQKSLQKFDNCRMVFPFMMTFSFSCTGII